MAHDPVGLLALGLMLLFFWVAVAASVRVPMPASQRRAGQAANEALGSAKRMSGQVHGGAVSGVLPGG